MTGCQLVWFPYKLLFFCIFNLEKVSFMLRACMCIQLEGGSFYFAFFQVLFRIGHESPSSCEAEDPENPVLKVIACGGEIWPAYQPTTYFQIIHPF